MNTFIKFATLTLGVATVVGSANADITVYANDFESNTAGFSTSGSTILPTDNGGYSSSATSTYLGKFAGSDSSDLSLTGLTVGATYSVSFDLFIGNSWDGNSTAFGPDSFSLKADGADLVNATFQNLFPGEASLSSYKQSYSDSTPIGGAGEFDALTGADVMYDGGSYTNRYGIYYFGHGAGNPTLSFIATGSSATLSFAGSGLQDVSDEFWAVDNVMVTTAVPAPEIWVSLGLGLGILTFTRRSR